MKTMWLAFAATAVIAVGADQVLDRLGFSARDVNSGGAVRLDSADK